MAHLRKGGERSEEGGSPGAGGGAVAGGGGGSGGGARSHRSGSPRGWRRGRRAGSPCGAAASDRSQPTGRACAGTSRSPPSDACGASEASRWGPRGPCEAAELRDPGPCALGGVEAAMGGLVRWTMHGVRLSEDGGQQHQVVVVHQDDVALLPPLGDLAREGVVQLGVVLPPLWTATRRPHASAADEAQRAARPASAEGVRCRQSRARSGEIGRERAG